MTQEEFEKMFLDLNSVLVKFWIEQGRPGKEVKIELLERMLNWYKKMGYITLDKQEEKKLPEGLKEAAEKHISKVFDAIGHPGWDWEMQDVLDAFKAGAKWDRAKMMEGAVETEVVSRITGSGLLPAVTFLVDDSYKEGDKVRVIVLPEEKVK